jgi:hypothetical protein
MPLSTRFQSLIGAAVLTVGCAGYDNSGEAALHATSLATETDGSEKKVGEPCSYEDGWVPKETVTATALAPAQPSQLDFPSLPTSIPYCQIGVAYPAGYFTMNCQADADCPSEARCDDGGKCRMPCTEDAECTAPMRCRPHGKPELRFCECASCVGGQ